MRYTKCCVPGCNTRRQDAVLLHKFPICANRRNMWLDSINCASLRVLSVVELGKQCVCHKHFEARFLTQKSRLLMQAYPTLFTEHEISTGVPTHSNSENQKPSSEFEHKYCRTLHIDHNYAASRPTDVKIEKSCWRSATRQVQRCDQLAILPDAGDVGESFADSNPVQELRGVTESCADAGDSGPVEEPRVDDTAICDDVGDDIVHDSDTLLESNICRVCLAMDVKMYDLKDIELREMFQNITGILVTDNNPSTFEGLCWECAGRLKAAAAFRNKALLSDALLQGLVDEQIRKSDITYIKENQDYLKSAGTLSIVEVFHPVQIDAEYEMEPSTPDNNDTDIVQNTFPEDSIEFNESIIEENIDQMEVIEESIIEAPIETVIEYDPFRPAENRNIVFDTIPISSQYIPLRKDTIHSAYSSLPGCSSVETKNTIIGYLKPPSDCDNKNKKTILKNTNKDLISKTVLKKPKEVICHDHTLGDAKLKNINLKVGRISKKYSNKKLVKKTQATDDEYLNVEYLEF